MLIIFLYHLLVQENLSSSISVPQNNTAELYVFYIFVCQEFGICYSQRISCIQHLFIKSLVVILIELDPL